MNKVRVILGPPGTGKTTEIMRQIETLLAAGVPPYEIAFVSYTNAAVDEGIDRASRQFDIDPDEFKYFLTVHKMACCSFRGAERRELMGDGDWKTFGESFAYSFNDEFRDYVSIDYAEDGDCLRTLHELRRSKRCSVDEAIMYAGDIPPHITPQMVNLFGERLSAWKTENSLIDFTDMLELGLKANWRPPVRFAFVDETQDSSCLQNKLTKKWFWENDRCEVVTYAGDDDQAIFGWSGGDRKALVRLAGYCETRILEQSYRCPQLAHACARSIIQQNTDRVPKVYRPRDDQGELLRATDARDAVSMAGDESMILVRNKMFATKYRDELIAAGRLFSCEVGKKSPLDRKDTLGAFRAISSLRRGGNAMAADFASLLHLVREITDGQRTLPHGAKKKSEENEDFVPIWRAREQFGLTYLMEVITRQTGMFDLVRGGTRNAVGPEERRYLELVLLRDPEMRRGKTILTTDHRSKGRESECVVISPEMANRSYRPYRDGSLERREEENSVQYVAATRTKSRLIVERTHNPRRYEYEPHMRAARPG